MWGKFEIMAIPLPQPHSASFPGCVGEGHSDVSSYCMVWEQGTPHVDWQHIGMRYLVMYIY